MVGFNGGDDFTLVNSVKKSPNKQTQVLGTLVFTPARFQPVEYTWEKIQRPTRNPNDQPNHVPTTSVLLFLNGNGVEGVLHDEVKAMSQREKSMQKSGNNSGNLMKYPREDLGPLLKV